MTRAGGKPALARYANPAYAVKRLLPEREGQRDVLVDVSILWYQWRFSKRPEQRRAHAVLALLPLTGDCIGPDGEQVNIESGAVVVQQAHQQQAFFLSFFFLFFFFSLIPS